MASPTLTEAIESLNNVLARVQKMADEIPSTSTSNRKRTANRQESISANPSEEKFSPFGESSKRKKREPSSFHEEDNVTLINEIQNIMFSQLVIKYSKARSKLDQARQELYKIDCLVTNFMAKNTRIVDDIGKFNRVLINLIDNDRSKMRTMDNFDDLVVKQQQRLSTAVEVIKSLYSS